MKRDQKKFNIKLDRVLQTGSVTNISAVQLELEGAEKWIAELQRAIQHQEDCLGLTGLTKLRELKDSKFLGLHLNTTISAQENYDLCGETLI